MKGSWELCRERKLLAPASCSSLSSLCDLSAVTGLLGQFFIYFYRFVLKGTSLSAGVIDGNTACGDENCARAIWWHNTGNNRYVSKKEKGIKDVLKFFSLFLICTYRYFCSPGLFYTASIAIEGKNVQNLNLFPTMCSLRCLQDTLPMFMHTAKNGIGLWLQQGFQDHIFVLHK